jgi:hypothetical protein
LASSSFPLTQPAPPPLPLHGNRPLKSPPLNRTTPPHHTPQLSSPRAPRTPSDTAELCSPPPLAHLAASPPKLCPPLGSPHCPFASRASAASHRAPEWPLGRTPVIGHCEVHGGPVDRPLLRGPQLVDSVHRFSFLKYKLKSGLILQFCTIPPELVINDDLAPGLTENQFLVLKFYVLVPRVSRPYNFLTVTPF